MYIRIRFLKQRPNAEAAENSPAFNYQALRTTLPPPKQQTTLTYYDLEAFLVLSHLVKHQHVPYFGVFSISVKYYFDFKLHSQILYLERWVDFLAKLCVALVSNLISFIVFADRQFEIRNSPRDFSAKYLILLVVASDDDDNIDEGLLNEVADEAVSDLIDYYERRIYQPASTYQLGLHVLRMDYQRNHILFFCRRRRLAVAYTDFLRTDFRFGGIT